MKKKLLSLIVSVAMVMTVFAGMTVTANADEAATATPEKTAFTVYNAVVDDEGNVTDLKVVKEYTAADFEKLAETGSIGGFYYKGDVWNGITSNTYVTVENLLADAGLNKDFVKALYATETTDEGTASVYTKCEYKEYLTEPICVYGGTKGSDTAFTGNPTEQPLAISVTAARGTVAADQTIADYMAAAKSTDTSYNVIAGSKDVADDGGKRLAQGISGIAVSVDQTAMDTAAAKALKVSSLTVKGSKSKAVVKYKKTAGAEKYKITYSKTKNFKKTTTKYTTKTAYTLKLKKGTYYVKVAAGKKVDGKNIYGKYSGYKKVVVK